ncbi:cytoskeleton-associated protein 2-like isoform X2 [Anoplopoma fimbria]|uniref:cytoskeleton-associated protein 2-like n=1 Tax=Anoplopoma fimbria TaxID=229290 RepID=UPI0023EBDD2F|nr:cytoskeleton-associated protein 2-like [Anoplopoma fimbria]XP_054483096.1 cytoskeleton-associated protein 2-like isoform X2 [Anoplopoma fimbria]
MEKEDTVSILSRKELRRQKLVDYLARKGKLKPPNPKPYLRADCQVTSTLQVVMGKENKAPADRFTYERPKIQTLAAQSTKHPATRGAFVVTHKVNVKANILTGRQNTNRPSATNGPAQPKPNQNLVLTRRSAVVSSRSNPNATNHLKKQPNTGIPSSGRASSNAALKAVTKSNSRFSSSSNATWSCPMTTGSVRISLGPMVKTKTGLIPAVTQPRNSQSQRITHTSATAGDPTTIATANVTKKVQSSNLSSVSVSHKSAITQRKPLPTTSLNNQERARAGIKVQNQSNSRPLFRKTSQPSSKIQLSRGQKSTSTFAKSTAAPLKPQGRAGAAGQPTDRFPKLRSEGGGQTKSQPCKVSSQTTSGVANRSSTRAAVAELGGKTKTSEQTNGRKGSSANAPPPQTGIKRTSIPVMSQTVPRLGKTISHTGQAKGTKTPKVPVRVIPQTEGKKVTAAQEERMKKLQEWQEAKGISYKRPPMPVKPQVRRTVALPQPFWGTMNEEDEAHSLICAVDRSLADCIKLLGEGCPPAQVKEVLSRLPAVSKKFAKYWICRARLMEQEGQLDVLPMFEEAVGVVLEPVDELRAVVFEILKKRDEIQASAENEREEDQITTCESSPESIDSPKMTPKPVRALICGEKGDSSVVKYKITSTPGGPPSQQTEQTRVNGQQVRFFTPVRRSVRIERSSLRYPASLQDHDRCVASYNDLISEEHGESGEKKQKGGETSPQACNTPMYVYRQNEALKDKVFVQLVYDEAV